MRGPERSAPCGSSWFLLTRPNRSRGSTPGSQPGARLLLDLAAQLCQEFARAGNDGLKPSERADITLNEVILLSPFQVMMSTPSICTPSSSATNSKTAVPAPRHCAT